jgi:hypothetical protein
MNAQYLAYLYPMLSVFDKTHLMGPVVGHLSVHKSGVPKTRYQIVGEVQIISPQFQGITSTSFRYSDDTMLWIYLE